MKRKKLLILLISFAFSLAGCGSKKAETTQGSVEINVLIDGEEIEFEESSSEEETEVVPETPVKFECMDEIKNASPDSGLVQIDDMLLQYGATGAELFEAINQSECEYTFEGNENQLVPAGDYEMVRFKKNGEYYFSISLKNTGTETIELKDCISDDIYALNASMGNFYYAGVNCETQTYSSIKESMGDYEATREFTGYDSRGDKRLAVLYKIPDSANIGRGEDIYIYYIFDVTTNELSSFMICDYKGSDSSLPW